MAADEQKVFELTILDSISLISGYRDEIAAGLNAKGLNIPVGSTISEIAFAANDTSDDSAIKASPTQFGLVKILSDDSSIDTYLLSSPVVFNAKYVNDELTSLSNSVDLHVDDLNSKDDILSTAIETLDNVINLNAYKNGELSNSISSLLFNMYYGTLRNLGCNVDSFGKCHLNNIALYRGGTLPVAANNALGANVTPVYLVVARLLNQAVTSSWYFSHKSTNNILMSAYLLSSEMIFSMQTVSGSNEIDADEIVKIFFLSSNTFDYPGIASTNYVRAVALVISSNTSSLVGLQTKPYDNTPSSNLSKYKPLVRFYDVVNLTTTENIDNRILASLTGINGSIATINGNIDTINNEIAYLSGELSTVTFSTIPTLTGKVETLETTISNETSGLVKKVADLNINKSTVKVTEGSAALSVAQEFIVRKVTPEEYSLRLSESAEIQLNELYVVSSDNLIAFNLPIKYVGDGELSNDAATMNLLSTVSANITNTVDTLNGTVEALSTNLSTAISNVINTNIPDLTTRVGTLETTTANKADTSAVSAKSSIKISEGLSGDALPADTLTIKKVSPEEYAEILATLESDIPSSEMYIVSADYLIGFDNKIVDVADGTEPTDAATFGLLSTLSAEVAELRSTVLALTEKINLLTATA